MAAGAAAAAEPLPTVSAAAPARPTAAPTPSIRLLFSWVAWAGVGMMLQDWHMERSREELGSRRLGETTPHCPARGADPGDAAP
ncbi:hypothetical protein GCM10011594_10060 [Nakamurella endophytica]|uniref:Uncharacterized protein n=1 Tax=Nakamurella endophytica TaxID=1748367 RepID=A0A917SPC9_9ACTN|nr:hypothetical protein GCM10011594_10060 [Nakamurella endophytica]